MTTDQQDEIVAAYAAGTPVEDIARRYGVTREQIEHLAGGPPPKPSRRDRGNRVLIGIGAGWIAATYARLLGADLAQQIGLWLVTTAVVYALTSRYAGSDSKR